MSRMSLFNSPFLLGFEQFEETVDRIAKASPEGYPPYNIEQLAGGGLRITLAVAGFAEAELAVEVDGRQLTIQGRRNEDQERVYLHRGIAARQFRRAFVLAEGIEVAKAELARGLLHIDLVRPDVASRVQSIAIKSAG